MYSIRYKTDDGMLSRKELSCWDEAMSCWENLMADGSVRIVPDPQTGLDISLPRNVAADGIPHSWALMVA
jgi:hypothetical protein